jgi:hypothetical protein
LLVLPQDFKPVLGFKSSKIRPIRACALKRFGAQARHPRSKILI